MKNSSNKSFIEILTIYKECWDTYNFSKLKPFLDEKIELHVDWYHRIIIGKKDCLWYLKHYFEIRKDLDDFIYSAKIDFYENENKEKIPYIIETVEAQLTTWENYYYVEFEESKIKKITVK